MSNTQNDKKIKISKLKYFYFILVFSILLISGTYAYQYINTTNNSVTGMGGCFNVNYTGQNIATTDLATTTNYQNGSRTTVTLSKHSSCKLYTEANIYLKTNNTTTAPIESIPALKYKVFNSTSQISEGTITTKNDYLLATVPLTDTSTTYTVYLYIDANLSIGQYDGKSYSGYVYAESNQTSTIEGNYLVNFDTNNGENLSLSKTVTKGQPYGWLPTPSKPGYEFKGWNGKNLLNLNIGESLPSSTAGSNATQRIFIPNTYIKGLAFNNYYNVASINRLTVSSNSIELSARSGYGVGLPILSSSNKTYTLSFDTNGTTNRGYSTLFYSSDGTLISYSNSGMVSNHMTKTFTTPNNTYYLVIEFYGSNTDENITISNIQLEEGSTATEYEPYYVTNSTTVTQAQNHTLTAQWEEKKTRVRFDANGGTVNIANKEVTYEDTYGNLPTPTKTGYTFKGWSLMPDGYQQLEYIQSNGTQYIDMGLKGTQNSSFDINFMITTMANGRGIFGHYGGTSGSFYIYSSGAGNLQYGYNGYANVGNALQANVNYTISSSGNKVTINGNSYSNGHSGNFTTAQNLILFNITGGTYTGLPIKLYSFRLYDSGGKVRDFIPCKNTNTNKYGLYDLANKKFYPNTATSGNDFTGGSNVYTTSSTIVTQDENHTLTAIWE